MQCTTTVRPEAEDWQPPTLGFNLQVRRDTSCSMASGFSNSAAIARQQLLLCMASARLLQRKAVAWGRNSVRPKRFPISAHDAEGRSAGYELEAGSIGGAAARARMQYSSALADIWPCPRQEEDVWMRVELHDASLVPAHLRPPPPAEKQPLGDSLRKALRSLSSSSGGNAPCQAPSTASCAPCAVCARRQCHRLGSTQLHASIIDPPLHRQDHCIKQSAPCVDRCASCAQRRAQTSMKNSDTAVSSVAGTMSRSFTAGLQRSLSSGALSRSMAGRRGFGRRRSASSDDLSGARYSMFPCVTQWSSTTYLTTYPCK